MNIPHYAGLGRRFLALLLDFLLFCAVFLPTTRIVKGTWLMQVADHKWNYKLFVTDPLCLIFLAIMFAYFVLLEGLFGKTLGKWLVGIRVIVGDGGRPGLFKSFLRNLLRVVDGLPALNILGAIMILISNERTRIGDLITRTRVVKVRP